MNDALASRAASFTAPDHLYTWLDVEAYFGNLALHGRWPDWLLEVDGFWDGLRLSVDASVTDDTLWGWLSQVLGPLTVDRDRRLLLLDDNGPERPLPVEVEREPRVTTVTRVPRFGERRVTSDLGAQLPPPQQETMPHGVAICAFHSFKGGVGRTLHCVAVARRLAARGARVLLVDGDLEAPGITWMLEAQGTRIDFSWEDFLALVHGANDGRYTDALSLGRKFLTNQELDDVVVMPSKRDHERIAPPRITPTDLLTADRSPYVVTETLAQLAHQLHVEVVLVDLRAGISELSAPILLDPRVHRVFVSTVSDQSVRGTGRILDELARKAPATRITDAPTTLILTQFNAQDHFDRLGQVAGDLRGAAARAAGVPIDRADELGLTTDFDIVSEPIFSPFNPLLLSLPASWTEVSETVASTGLGDIVRPLVDLLAPAQQSRALPGTDADPTLSLDDLRRRLAERSEQLVFAETAHEQELLVTDALTNLVASHRVDVPVEVVVGAKGSGKTFTFLTLCRSRSWRGFAQTVGNVPVEVHARVVPVLTPINLDAQDRDDLRDAQVSAAEQLTGQEAATTSQLHDLIRAQLGVRNDDLTWRRLWLTCLARAVGLNADVGNVETRLADFARRSRAVFVIDGLEDLFQDFTTNPHQQQALRILLQDCPEWLRTLRGRPLGLVVFVRRDLVENSIKQNVAQFLARHQPYELRWNRVEALRLAAWISQRARAINPKASVQKADEKQLSGALLPLWGEKMGSASSRQARSDTWFLVALSDFNQQIQARDIVAFLRSAARRSIGDARWTDRLITPTAMRDALPECSREKIVAIQTENPPVGTLLEKLRTLPADARRIPFADLEAVGLHPSDTRLLETNGVLFKEGEKYWIPEIFRHGLGFRATGRPRVVTVANLAYRRASG